MGAIAKLAPNIGLWIFKTNRVSMHRSILTQRLPRDNMPSDPSSSVQMPKLNSIWSVLPIVPIGLAILFIVISNATLIGFRLLLPYPVSAWEAGFVTDAWRMLQGDPIYGIGADHATHMYGPLTTVVLALAFEFSGPALELGRLMSLISGSAAIILLAAIFGHKDRLTFAIAVALLLAVEGRTVYYLAETRPDMNSAFITILALIVLFQGLESTKSGPRAALTAAGSGLLMIAVMFKQTAVAFVFVPMLAVLPHYGKSYFRKQLTFAVMPVAAALATMLAVWYLAPRLWHFMVEVPAQYNISIRRMSSMAIELLATVPLFSLALIHWCYTDARNDLRSPRACWLIAATACAIPSSLAAFAKEGGWLNSLIPALLCIGAFCAWRAPVAINLLRDSKYPILLRCGMGFLFSVFMIAHVYPEQSPYGGPGWQLRLEHLEAGWGVPDRSKVIAETRLLRGKVVCPDDPTIPLMAKGYAGRSSIFESDAVRSSQAVEKEIAKEMQSADYVITMWGAENNLLKTAGFTKSEFRTTLSPVYELWRRTKQQ
jgi:hypothetical protein